jgi:hypothetical protein
MVLIKTIGKKKFVLQVGVGTSLLVEFEFRMIGGIARKWERALGYHSIKKKKNWDIG